MCPCQECLGLMLLSIMLIRVEMWNTRNVWLITSEAVEREVPSSHMGQEEAEAPRTCMFAKTQGE